MKIGEKLRSLRKARGFTAEQLSKISNVSRSYILQIESGHRTEVSNKIIEKLSNALRVNPDYFKIEGASLPMDCLDLPLDIIELIANMDNMPYLKLTKKAKENRISPEELDEIISLLIRRIKKRSQRE